MRLCKAAIVAAGISIVLSTAADSHHPAAVVAASITKALGIPVAGGGAGALAGGFVVGVGVAVVVCGLNEPKRGRRDIWVDGRHDVYPTYLPRKTGCVVKRARTTDPAQVKPFSK